MTDANSSREVPGAVYEYGDRQPSDVVVEALSEVTGGLPSEPGPLYDAVDPEALDAAMAHGQSLRTSFTYAGHEVVVTPGRVYVRPLEEA